MRNIIFLLGIFLVSSCNIEELIEPIGDFGDVFVYSDKYEEELYVWPDRFIADGLKNGVDVSHIKDGNISFHFTNNESYGGRAWGKNNDASILIFISKRKWNFTSSRSQKILMYHELGHDVLNLSHGQGMIMTKSQEKYKSKYDLDEMITELFEQY